MEGQQQTEEKNQRRKCAPRCASATMRPVAECFPRHPELSSKHEKTW